MSSDAVADRMTKAPIVVAKSLLPTACNLRPYLERIDENRQYTNYGPLVFELENRLSAYFERRQDPPASVVALLNSGTTALTLALMSQNPEPGTLCIMPSWTFAASAHAVISAGLIPYFVDVDPYTWALDPKNITQLIAQAPAEVSACMVVAPFGAPLNLAAWEDTFADTKLALVIDAAAGFVTAQPIAYPTVVSLHATKSFSIGEGGLVLSTNQNLLSEVRQRANFGFEPLGGRIAMRSGMNGKLSEYAAAIGHAALDVWPETSAHYMDLAKEMCDRLSNVGDITFQPGFGATWFGSVCSIKVPWLDANLLSQRLEQKNVQTRRWWHMPCHQQTAFEKFDGTAMPVTEDLHQQVLGMPFHLDLTSEDINCIAEAMGELRHEIEM